MNQRFLIVPIFYLAFLLATDDELQADEGTRWPADLVSKVPNPGSLTSHLQ